MYKNAVEILNQKWEGNMSQELNEKTKEGWHFTASFPAPYYLDIVWKTFIRYDEGYRAFCENLCGGYIDRPEPEFEKYKEIQGYFWDSAYTQALRSVWPKYGSEAEFLLDKQFEVYGDEAFHEMLQTEVQTELEKLIEEQDDVTRQDIYSLVTSVYESH